MKDNMKRAPFSTQIDLSKFDMKDFAKASDEEKRQQEVMGESTTFFKDGLKRLRKNPLAMGSIIVLVLLILVILLAPKIVPYGYADIVKGAQNLGPFQYSDAEQAQIDAGEKLFPHIFGTDELGRDYFIRVVYGARVSLGRCVCITACAYNRYHLRFRIRLLRWQGRYGYDENSRYHLFIAGYAAHHFTCSCIK